MTFGRRPSDATNTSPFGSILLAAVALLVGCGSTSAPPWFAPDAIDDTTWGSICGPRHRVSSDPAGYAGGKLFARQHHEWLQAESTHGLSVSCKLDRGQKSGALLELSAQVQWSPTIGVTLRDAEPIIDRITAAITNEVKPWSRPLVTMVANSRHSLAGRRLPGRFLVYGGYDWRWNSWSLRVTIREGDM